jgi:hypothetical protein
MTLREAAGREMFRQVLEVRQSFCRFSPLRASRSYLVLSVEHRYGMHEGLGELARAKTPILRLKPR